MDWPHDPDGEKGSEGGRKYGMAIFAKKVDEDDDFPLAFDEFSVSYGEDPIRLNHETVVPAKQILEFVNRDVVENMEEFHRAIGNAIRSDGFVDGLATNPDQ